MLCVFYSVEINTYEICLSHFKLSIVNQVIILVTIISWCISSMNNIDCINSKFMCEKQVKHINLKDCESLNKTDWYLIFKSKCSVGELKINWLFLDEL